MEAVWTRFQPLTLEVKRIAESGTLGAPIVLHADLSGNFDINSAFNVIFRENTSNGISTDIPKTHRILDPALGGGALLDL